jgi:hypothetical protein
MIIKLKVKNAKLKVNVSLRDRLFYKNYERSEYQNFEL